MDASQWSQQVASLPKQMDEITSPTPPKNPPNSRDATPQQSLERRTRPQKDQIINCPRCNSTNTKFCYYNNYSLTQPRYFCKTCRRYWTQGGSLRSVPVGGGSRKNKRSSSILSSTPQVPPSTNNTSPQMHNNNNNKLIIPDLNPPTSLSHLLSSQNPNDKFLEGHDLNLAFPMQGLFHHHIDHQHHQLPKIEGNNNNNENHEQHINVNPNNNSSTNNSSCPTTTNNSTTSTPISALEFLRSGISSRGNLHPFIPMSMPNPSTLYQSGYPNLQEFKPIMNFFSSPSEHNNVIGSNNDDHNNNSGEGGARLLFPFTDMNKLATNTQQHHDDQIDDTQQHLDDQIFHSKGINGNDDHHHHNNHHSGYWNGMLGGGTW